MRMIIIVFVVERLENYIQGVSLRSYSYRLTRRWLYYCRRAKRDHDKMFTGERPILPIIEDKERKRY